MYIVHLHKSMCILILYTICDLFRLSPIRLGTMRNKTCTSWFVSYIKWNYGCGNFIKQYPPAQKYECWRIINSWTNKLYLHINLFSQYFKTFWSSSEENFISGTLVDEWLESSANRSLDYCWVLYGLSL